MLPFSSSMMELLLSLLLLVSDEEKHNVFSESTLERLNLDEYIPCDEGWYYFSENCYKAVGQKENDRKTFSDSKIDCKKDGGILVHFKTEDQYGFILSFLLPLIAGSTWVSSDDVSIMNDGTNNTLEKPTSMENSKEGCSHLLYETEGDMYGKLEKFWNDDICTDYEYGYICQKNISIEKKSPNPMSCVSKGQRGVKLRSFCYHVIEEEKSWKDAEQHCKDNFDGHLVTILDFSTDVNLVYLLAKNISKYIWIGIDIHERTGVKWTSGWYASYSRLSEPFGQLKRSKGLCVIRKDMKEWSLIPCAKKYSFVCEQSQVIPPVLKSPPNSHCPEIRNYWVDPGGEYCYHLVYYQHLNWFDAKLFCKGFGTHLVSIHSKDEQDVLLPFVVSQNTPLYIGLNRLWTEDFVWDDGSKRDYDNWKEGEPKNSQRKCAKININDATWSDGECESAENFICSVRKNFVWDDGSKRDYDNWKEGEPKNSQRKCAKININDATWSDGECESAENFICSVRKITSSSTRADEITVISVTPSSRKVDSFTVFAVMQNSTAKVNDTTDSVDLKFAIGISVGIALVILLLGFAIYYFRRWLLERRKNSTAVRTTPPATWTVPERQEVGDDGYICMDDGHYEVVT